MGKEYLDKTGLQYLWGKLKSYFVSDVKVDNISVVTNGVANINTMVGATTSTDGTKGLVPAPEGTENINEYYLNAKGLWTHLEPTTSTYNGELRVGIKYGSNSALLTLPTATTSANGVMSSTDKAKLDSVSMTNGIIDTSCLPSVLTASDKYTRSSAGSLEWTNQTEGDAKVMMKSAVAFWSGAYNGTSSSLSYFNANAYFGGTQMKDFVTDQGTSSSWYYRKWKSGKIEAWTTYNAGSQTPSQWVTGWYYKDVNVAIPSGIFSATPTHVQATNIGSDYQYSVFTACPTSSTSIKVRVVKPNSGAATPVLSIYASNMI